MIDVPAVNQLHTSTVARWHNEPIDQPYGDPLEAIANTGDRSPNSVLAIICQQHQYNYLLWHQEDIARSVDVSEAQIAQVKRNIDKYNQARNDWIEKVDDWITADLQRKQIQAAAESKLNTETPGSSIDRLSIMALRIYHLKEQLERSDIDQAHIDKVTHRLAVCGLQFADLSNSLSELLADIYSGTKRHKTYRQMKMYNDPSLNPYLYNRQAKTS
ncbi:MAG: DUF4254 domain-containing protein [Planctomycetota bacterium]|nr:DUF4254 domain-containing protein [Planctomycetota bacterium]